MTTHAPRPALRKAADAHIHPAAPSHPARPLHAVPPVDDVPGPGAGAVDGSAAAAPEPHSSAPTLHRLAGPPTGATSDALRATVARSRQGARGGSKEKAVELTVKVPKSLRKEFRAAVRADGKDPDQVATALLQAWLHG